MTSTPTSGPSKAAGRDTVWLIVNERAGAGRGAHAGEAARAELQKHGVKVEWRPTRGAGDAVTLAREARAAGAPVVAAVGGDGTLHEVVNGLVLEDVEANRTPDPTRLPALGAIPVGSGNDYVKMLGVSRTDPARAASALVFGPARAVDVGLLEGSAEREGQPRRELFLNNLGLAFTGDANAWIGATRGLPGGTAYFIGAAIAFFTFQRATYEIELDGMKVHVGRPTIVHVNLGKYCGGGVIFTPEAELDDGFFDVLIFGEVTRLDCLIRWNAITTGKGRELDDVAIMRAREVKVRGPQGRLLHADGEVRKIAQREMVARVVPRALNVIQADPVQQQAGRG
jgi:YegS/Rv2252/BmrU family lipid kinase